MQKNGRVKNFKMTFILDGKEHEKEMKRVRRKLFIPPKLIGIWHSHTTEDHSLSLQDRKSNQLLEERFGKIISVIVTRKRRKKKIQLTVYPKTMRGWCLWKKRNNKAARPGK